ncbi:MAG: hypothetical protein JWQ65_738 [Devosia sp.]|nr:hypothetical protein [Devosia sp.]
MPGFLLSVYPRHRQGAQNDLRFLLAAACEISGCFLVWQALRLNQPWLWLPALLALAAFAWLLTLTGTASAGRAFAAYGGIYVAASLLFMLGVERIGPDLWDILGALVCIAGAAIIVFAPRAG